MWRILTGLAGAIIVVILAWLGVWFYAEMRLQQLVEAKLNQINASGPQQVTYDRLETSHSPLVAGLTLINPRLKVTVDSSEPPVVMSVARIGAHVSLFHPLTLHITPSLRVMIKNQGSSAIIAFGKVHITEILNPAVWRGNLLNPISSGSAVFTGINILASDGSLEVAQIDNFSFHEALNAHAGKDRAAITLTEDMQNFRLSPLLTKLLGLPFNGQINSLSSSLIMSGPLNWEQIAQEESTLQDDDQRTKLLLRHFHHWAEAGGHAKGSLNLWVGPSQMHVGFNLHFEQQAQPAGETEIFANNLGKFSNALTDAYPGLQGWVSEAQALLSSYISTTAQDGEMLNIHVKYGQRGVFVNGQKTGTMPPLDWQYLLGSDPASFPTPQPGSSGAL